MLKDYLESEQQNVALRHIGYCRRIEWVTNKQVFPSSGYIAVLRRNFEKDDLYRACERLATGMQILDLYAAATADRQLAKKLRALIVYLRTLLVTPEAIGETGDAWTQYDDPFEMID